MTTLLLGEAYDLRGEYRRASGYLKQTIALQQGDRVYDRLKHPGLPSVMARLRLVYCLSELGEFSEGMAIAEEAIRIAEAADHPFTLPAGYIAAGVLDLGKGELANAIRRLERALSVSEKWDLPFWLPRIGGTLGTAYALSGRIDAALTLVERARSRSSAHLDVEIALGTTYLRIGRLDEARQFAARALGQDQRGAEARALWLLAEIGADPACFDGENAERDYVRAMKRGSERGMRPLVAHCHLGLGKLYQRTEKREQAREHLTTATAMYRDMEMRFYLEQAEAELREHPR